MSCEQCKNEKEAINSAVSDSRIMADMVQMYDKQNARLWGVVIAFVVGFVVVAFCALWSVQNGQSMLNEAVLSALEEVSEIERTSEVTSITEIIQDTGEGSGNNVFLDGNNTTYNESEDS